MAHTVCIPHAGTTFIVPEDVDDDIGEARVVIHAFLTFLFLLENEYLPIEGRRSLVLLMVHAPDGFELEISRRTVIFVSSGCLVERSEYQNHHRPLDEFVLSDLRFEAIVENNFANLDSVGRSN
ncbi:hypothetical protein Tco_0351845 [Tanacetum coccineum]